MKIEILADRKIIKADGKDLSYIAINLLNKEETPIRNNGYIVNFYVSGDAHIVRFENDRQFISGKFKTISGILKSGMASLVLQAGKTPQVITVTAIIHSQLLNDNVKIKLINICKKYPIESLGE